MKMYSGHKLGPRVRVAFPDGEGMTKQAMQDECDINQIMARFIKTGAVEHTNKFSSEYGFATSGDLHEALSLVSKGESIFAELPAAIRAGFNQDVGLFLDYVQDPSNLDPNGNVVFLDPTKADAGSPPPPPEVPPVGGSPPEGASEDA